MKRTTFGRILIMLGVCAWIPYFALKLAGASVEMLPFLVVHLLGVIPGALLAPSETIWSRLLGREAPDKDQTLA
ncbi:MAG: hypothetical protein HY327_00375 [Chloroflexi bacterium]|nr:hypothetical protein [Chloroflexota bacterium]